MFITYRQTRIVFPYFITIYSIQQENLQVLKDFVYQCKNRYSLTVKVIQLDNKLNRGNIQRQIHDQGITFKPLAPNTHDQNRQAKRSGGVIMAKARVIRIKARLPHDLWIESVNLAVYLFNQTPRYINQWQTLYKRFYTYINRKESKSELEPTTL